MCLTGSTVIQRNYLQLQQWQCDHLNAHSDSEQDLSIPKCSIWFHCFKKDFVCSLTFYVSCFFLLILKIFIIWEGNVIDGNVTVNKMSKWSKLLLLIVGLFVASVPAWFYFGNGYTLLSPLCSFPLLTFHFQFLVTPSNYEAVKQVNSIAGQSNTVI